MEMEALKQRLARLAPLPLGHFPTPLAPLKRLSKALDGPEIWIKRDDLSGLGGGGNKVRKLRYLVAEALRQEADVIMTTGAQQSNHARQTAGVAAHLGVDCVLVLGGEAPSSPQGNYLLDRCFGAEVRWAGDRPLMSALQEEAGALRAEGRRPYVIPYGGSNALGACGYVEAAVEWREQTQGLSFNAIVVASSSGGTQAGLAVALQALGIPTRVVGISIGYDAATLRQRLADIAANLRSRLDLDAVPGAEAFVVVDAYLGGGYGVVGALERDAIRALARHEGLLADPVYTGRALGGLMDLVRQGYFERDARVLFWHTGGAPGLYAYARELGI
ncbi:MAG: D-cysteine desulfhydrase family protein [Anaerolineae bacterium]